MKEVYTISKTPKTIPLIKECGKMVIIRPTEIDAKLQWTHRDKYFYLELETDQKQEIAKLREDLRRARKDYEEKKAECEKLTKRNLDLQQHLEEEQAQKESHEKRILQSKEKVNQIYEIVDRIHNKRHTRVLKRRISNNEFGFSSPKKKNKPFHVLPDDDFNKENVYTHEI
jgi:chromosome segregation ATPase